MSWIDSRQGRLSIAGVTIALAGTVCLGGCSDVTGMAVMKPVPTNASGKPILIFTPCGGVPAAVLRKQLLDSVPVGTTARSNSDGFESRACVYRAANRRYEVEIVAANDSLAIEEKEISQRGQTLSVAGRRARWFDLTIPGRQGECAIDIAATTGIYGVRVITKGADYGRYRNCFSMVDHYTEAFVRFFPQ